MCDSLKLKHSSIYFEHLFNIRLFLKAMISMHMKQNLLFIAISFLLFDFVYAQTTPDSTDMSITLDSESYSDGDTVNINGLIKNIEVGNLIPITIKIIDVNENIVMIDQFMPMDNGTFKRSYFVHGPMWKNFGEYDIIVNYNNHDSKKSFVLENTGKVIDMPVSSQLDEQYNELPQLDEQYNELPQLDEQYNELPQLDEQYNELPQLDEQYNELPQLDEQYNELPQLDEQYNELPQLDEQYNELPQLDEPIVCGPGTIEKDGMCIPEVDVDPIGGGGCLIATSTYDSELSHQVQSLRNIRDDIVLNNQYGKKFMVIFNNVYYTFSPTISDLERDHPLLKEIIKVGVMPLLNTLSIMHHVDDSSEINLVVYGTIAAFINILIYVVIPVLILVKLKTKIKMLVKPKIN